MLKKSNLHQRYSGRIWNTKIGSITTGLGEIYQYITDVKPGYQDMYDPMELSAIQEWIVKSYLTGKNGVVEVNSWGEIQLSQLGIDEKELDNGGFF